VRIVNVWSTQALGWNDIEAFAVRSYGPAKAKTVGGESVDIFAIQQSNWATMRNETDTPAARMIDELNASLQRSRSGLAGAGAPRVRSTFEE
jgi:hypothetical protein